LVVTHSLLAHDRLHVSRAVSNCQKMEFPAIPAAPQPASDCDGFPDMLSGLFNGNDRHGLYSSASSQLNRLEH
jgi:hypothetical protein